MIVKIHQSNYYGYMNKTKELFKKKYRGLGLRWMEKVTLPDGSVVDGWFSQDKKEYLLKLPEEGEIKRFTGNSSKMIDFLVSCGAEIINNGNKEEEKGCHIDYNDMKGYSTQESRYGMFIGGDLESHYLLEWILKKYPDNSNRIIWNEKDRERIEGKKQN